MGLALRVFVLAVLAVALVAAMSTQDRHPKKRRPAPPGRSNLKVQPKDRVYRKINRKGKLPKLKDSELPVNKTEKNELQDHGHGGVDYGCDYYYYDGFECDDGLCITGDWVCDGYDDCTYGEDEVDCGPYEECYDDEFYCYNTGYCIPLEFECDNYEDCEYGEDEHDCQERECNHDEYKCPSGVEGDPYNPCIPKHYLCDKYWDCDDGEDEEGCPEPCFDDEFTCNNNDCVHETLVNDCKEDCSDGSDEWIPCPECDEGWEQYETSCFALKGKPSSHSTATSTCKADNATLPRTKTKEALFWLVDQLPKSRRKQWLWLDLGLGWEWGDGTALIDTALENPPIGVPNRCLAAKLTDAQSETDLLWRESICSKQGKKALVICEKPAI